MPDPSCAAVDALVRFAKIAPRNLPFNLDRKQGTVTAPPSSNPAWSEAVERAARLTPPESGALVFFEEREDLTVEASSRTGAPVVRHGRLRGLSVRVAGTPGKLLHLANPDPGAAEPLARAALDSRPRFPNLNTETRDDRQAVPTLLDPRPAVARLAGFAEDHPDDGKGFSWTLSRVQFEQRVLIARRDMPVAFDRRQSARLRLEGTLIRGDRVAEAVAEAVLTPEADESETMRSLLGTVLRRTVQRLEATRAPTGECPAVLAPGVGGVLVHELVGHALEADVALRGSWLARAEGQVADRDLIVLDDPRRSRAAWRVDDEGERPGATSLLRNGVVTGRLHDLETARRSGRPTTGHGRRATYRDPVRPRMGCTFVAAGRFEPEEVLRETDRGIYVRRMEAASVEPLTGRAVFRVTDADRIHNGRLDGPLHPHLLFVDARTALTRVDRVAGDLAFDTCIGSCHRDGQPLAISVGAPTIRIGLTTVFT